MRSDAETIGAAVLWPSLIGHEGTTFIALDALAVMGPPLGPLITRTTQGLTPSHRGIADRWTAGREERANAADAADAADARMMIKELAASGRFSGQTAGAGLPGERSP